jgi:hypothetical protein
MDQDAVKELARRIIEECAPDELELFESTADIILLDLPRAVAGDGRQARPTSAGFATLIPVMIKLALFLADHLAEAAAEVGIAKLGDAALERRRRRKKAAKGQPPTPERLISIEVNRRRGGESGTEIIVFVSDRGFPVSAAQAAGLIGFVGSYLASAPGAVPPPSDEDGPRESGGGQPQG